MNSFINITGTSIANKQNNSTHL